MAESKQSHWLVCCPHSRQVPPSWCRYRGHLLGAQDVGAAQAGSDPCGLSWGRWRVAHKQGFPTGGAAGGRDLEVLLLGPGSPALVLVHRPTPGQGPGYRHRVSPAPCWHLAGPPRWPGRCWLSGALASGQAASGMVWAMCRRLQSPTAAPAPDGLGLSGSPGRGALAEGQARQALAGH